ncbi:MAG: CvpA family protein [Mollicutes bacterium]|nr:CvpA family protein [Mollicutes bacterium]
MNFIDWLIIVIIGFAMINGFRQGIINSVIAFIGTLLVFILAFYLKNPISIFLYEKFPFFNLGGKFAGVSVFNVLIYEGISYIITISLLAIILKVISKVTGIFNSLLNATLVLGIPSKILGALVGLFQGYVIAFLTIFILGLISGTSTKVNESKYAGFIMEKTPVLSEIVGDTYKSITEVYDICVSYKNQTNKDEANLRSLEVLLKYEILSVDSADVLIAKERITTSGSSIVVDKYRKDK